MNTQGTANMIIDYYLNNSELSNQDIAKHFSVSKQYVGKVLKKHRSDEKKALEKEIMYLFYDEGKSMTEISKATNTSLPTIRNILKKDKEKFIETKMYRKKANEEKHKQARVIGIRKKRMLLEDVDIMNYLKRMQSLCAMEDSRTAKLTTDQIVTLTLQHYTYNKEKKSYLFNLDYEAPADLPKVYKTKSIYVESKAEQKDKTAKFYAK